MRHLALLLTLALPAWGADIYPRIGYQGILITDVIGAVDLTPEEPENPTGPASIAGMAVDESGWVLEVYIRNLSTGGSYAYGFDTNNNVVAGTKLAMNVTSQGYTTNGQPTTLTRTLYGTKRIRKPYPNEATADEAIAGSTVKIKLALSDYVYSGDSNLTATVLEGLYAQGGTNSLAATSVTVTNRSGRGYFQPVVNWSARGYRVIDSSTNLDLRLVAFHRHAQQGQQVRAVEFVVRDSGGTSFTNWQTQMTLTTNLGDANPIVEYVANFPTNTLASGLVTCDARVFPWVGDSSTVRDSRLYTGHTAHFRQLTNAVNYARVRAIVNATSGSDTTGRAADEVYWATNTSPPKFQTIGRALLHAANTNNANYGRGAQFGGAIIYLEEGSHTNLGSSISLTAVNTAVEALITPATGASKAATIIAGDFGSDVRAKDDSDILTYKGLTISVGTDTTVWSRVGQLTFEDCNINSETSPLIQQTTTQGLWIVERCAVTNLAMGFKPYTTQLLSPALIRGNTIWGNVPVYYAMNFIGNTKTTNAAQAVEITDMTASPMGTPYDSGKIFAFNRILNHAANNMINFGMSDGVSLTNGGFAIVQNLMEYGGTDTLVQGNMMFNDDTSHFTNVVVLNNTFAGTKYNTAYNDTGTNATWRVGFAFMNNLYDWKPIKSDTFTTGNGGRIGNWESMFGVAHFGNAFVNTTNIGAGFVHDFPGLGSFWNENESPTNYMKFVRRGGWDGLTLHPTGGDYRLQTTTPLTNRNTTVFVLPYDLAGRARSTNDPPGAYSELVAP